MDNNNMQLRKRAFGGFDRQDVVSFVEKLASERNELQDDNQKLRMRVEELETELEESKKLAAYIEELEYKLKNAEEKLAEKDAAADDISCSAADIISELDEKYKEVKADIDITTTHARCELNKMQDQLLSLNAAVESAGRKIKDLKAEIDNKQ